MKKLAIIGQPNVGKSSLFNRILKERDAITSEQAGTTRDMKRRVAEINEKYCEILDTGGLDSGNELFDKIKEKSLQSAYDADIILYMVDGKKLPDDEDRTLFYELEKMGKSVALVVNKIDNDKMKEKLWEFYSFGTDNIFGISVSHNRHVAALFAWIANQLPESSPAPVLEEESLDDDFDAFLDTIDDEEEASQSDIFEQNDQLRQRDDDLDQMNVAIIGRVNVGKSSLLNALIQDERAIVSPIAGTTIDPIDETFSYNDRTITFIDTAGIRKRGKILGIEKFALHRTQQMLEKAHIALLVLDASNPFTELDEKIVSLIDKNRLGCIIVLNKWDIADKDAYQAIVEEIHDRFKFIAYAPIITLSALTKQRVNKLYDLIIKVNDAYSKRISTSKLNEVFEKAQRKHHIPSKKGMTVRLYYATQYDTRPPRIALVLNRPEALHFTYRRYLINQLREAYDFEGTPILFKAKGRS